MKTKGVKEAFEHVHHQQDTHRNTGKDNGNRERRRKVDVQSRKHSFLPKRQWQVRRASDKAQRRKYEAVFETIPKTNSSLNSLVNNNLAESTVIVFLPLRLLTVSSSSAWWTMGECVFCDTKVRLSEKQDRNGGKGNKEKGFWTKPWFRISVRQHFPVEGQC
jgi:hypothetical protein